MPSITLHFIAAPAIAEIAGIDSTTKIAYWRAFPGIAGPEPAPALEFVYFKN
ncbi:MAG: hypothetical protein IPP88_19230 [Betaproteobacteria bacterium]|nr:hypothetical protein [Betaproteobacteria bacterium]